MWTSTYGLPYVLSDLSDGGTDIGCDDIAPYLTIQGWMDCLMFHYVLYDSFGVTGLT